jgi:hypothetical protein
MSTSPPTDRAPLEGSGLSVETRSTINPDGFKAWVRATHPGSGGRWMSLGPRGVSGWRFDDLLDRLLEGRQRPLTRRLAKSLHS